MSSSRADAPIEESAPPNTSGIEIEKEDSDMTIATRPRLDQRHANFTRLWCAAKPWLIIAIVAYLHTDDGAGIASGYTQYGGAACRSHSHPTFRECDKLRNLYQVKRCDLLDLDQALLLQFGQSPADGLDRDAEEVGNIGARHG